MSFSDKKNFSRTVLILLIALFSIVGISKKWQNPLSWDAFGYHLYLPAAFLWDDVQLKDFSKVEQINSQYQSTGTLYQGEKTENGSWMIKYTIGLAVMEAPFFLTAHLVAPSLGYAADGFSNPYQLAFLLAHFIYLFIGLVFLRRVLLKFFDDKITGWLLMLLVFGTNFYVMALLTGGMTPVHTLEFSILATVLYYTLAWHEKASWKSAVGLGVALGLAVLVRPSDIVFGLVPLLWNVKDVASLKDKLKTLAFRRQHILFIAVVFLLIIFPQLYYWKKVAGSWLLFTYSNNPGEGFDFSSPHLWSFLFSFRKGWLIYTPLMIFSLIGFVSLYRKNITIFWPLLVFFLANLYVISSWSCWWYAGSFSQRAMVDSYALMLIPMGYFLMDLFDWQKAIYTKSVIGILGVLIALNLFQSWQYSQQILDDSRMTASYYFRIFGKTSVTAADKKLLLIGRSTGETEVFDETADYKKKILFENNFNVPPPDQLSRYSDTLAKEGAWCFRLDSTLVYTRRMEKQYSTITRKDHAWIRTTFWYYPVYSAEEAKLSLVVTFDHNDAYYKYEAADIGINATQKAIPGQWNKFVFDYLTPEVRSKNDKVNIYLWLRGKGPVYIDDLKVEAFEKK